MSQADKQVAARERVIVPGRRTTGAVAAASRGCALRRLMVLGLSRGPVRRAFGRRGRRRDRRHDKPPGPGLRTRLVSARPGAAGSAATDGSHRAHTSRMRVSLWLPWAACTRTWEHPPTPTQGLSQAATPPPRPRGRSHAPAHGRAGARSRVGPAGWPTFASASPVDRSAPRCRRHRQNCARTQSPSGSWRSDP